MLRIRVKGIAQKIELIPNSVDFTTAATEGQKSVDGDENQRREVAGGEETIRRPEEVEQDTRAG